MARNNRSNLREKGYGARAGVGVGRRSGSTWVHAAKARTGSASLRAMADGRGAFTGPEVPLGHPVHGEAVSAETVAVVVVTFQPAACSSGCWWGGSGAGQRLTPLLVVDNASTDDTPACWPRRFEPGPGARPPSHGEPRWPGGFHLGVRTAHGAASTDLVDGRRRRPGPRPPHGADGPGRARLMAVRGTHRRPGRDEGGRAFRPAEPDGDPAEDGDPWIIRIVFGPGGMPQTVEAAQRGVRGLHGAA